MHTHLEIVMPPTDDIDGAIKQIMDPWDENTDDEDERNNHAFWDFYVIGGRWAGDKFVQALDKDLLQRFYDWCNAEKVTCSGLICGKQELNPADQIPKVDAKWNEMFTPAGSEHVACPLFRHSNDQFDSDGRLNGDVWPLSRSLHATCGRIIFAGPGWVDNAYSWKRMKAEFMLVTEAWNGCTHQKTDWDGSVLAAWELATERMSHYKDTYRELVEPKDDWLCVTVDYHS